MQYRAQFWAIKHYYYALKSKYGLYLASHKVPELNGEKGFLVRLGQSGKNYHYVLNPAAIK